MQLAAELGDYRRDRTSAATTIGTPCGAAPPERMESSLGAGERWGGLRQV
jgi:hypothetical protein